MAVAGPLPPSLHLGVTGQEQPQSMLVRDVVRGVVDNMEFVLDDLHGIMGDIQSLVRHIDSVTGRAGRQARRARNESRFENTRHSETPEKKEEHRKKASNGKHEQLGRLSQHCQTSGAEQNSNLDFLENTSSDALPAISRETGKHCKRTSYARKKNTSKRFSDSVLCGDRAEVNISAVDNANLSANARPVTFHSSNSAFDEQATEASQRQFRRVRDAAILGGQEDVCTGSEDVSQSIFSDEMSSSKNVPQNSRRPFYQCHGRQESTASRGEYDLATLEAKFGHVSDVSDDHSLVSIEDSPLRLKNAQRFRKKQPKSSGAIAVVHPILKPALKKLPLDKDSSKETSLEDISRYGLQRVNNSASAMKQVQECEKTQNKGDSDGYEIPVLNASSCCGYIGKSRQLLVYNASFQPVTPTEHIFQDNGNSLSCRTNNQYIRTSNSQHPEAYKSSKLNTQALCPTDHTSLPNSPMLRRAAPSLRVGFDIEGNVGSVVHRTSHPRPVYARIAGSPGSSRSSSSIVRQPNVHHYYHSIDSDMDSDNIPGFLDGRTITPDLDWSYLNLMGAGTIGSVGSMIGMSYPEGCLATNTTDVYETPAARFRLHNTFEIFATSPGIVRTMPFYYTLVSKSASSQSEPSTENARDMDGLDESPMSPLVCDGISANTANDYCGCYEAALDSVLENVAGFESLEEACASFDTDDILNETYISFEEQFEEDDWDVGLGPDVVPEFSVEVPLFCFDEDEETLENLSEAVSHAKNTTLGRPVNRPSVLSLSRKAAPLTPENLATSPATDRADLPIRQTKSNNVNLPASCSADTQYLVREKRNSGDRLLFDHISCKSSSASNSSCCKTSSQSSTNETLDDDRSCDLTDDNDAFNRIMIASYDTSCQAVASGSPMSLCSSDAAPTTPSSECCLVTSSEGDDLFTSHEESYFLLSPSSPSNSDVNNALAKRCHQLGRTSARELTQQFLVSLRDVCERHGGPVGDELGSGGADGSNDDTGECNDHRLRLNVPSSDFPGSSDSSTVTNSTATDATLTLEEESTYIADNRSPSNVDCINADNANTADAGGSSYSSNGSYLEDTLNNSRYNRNVNTWTAFTTMVHVHADDVSDGTASDIVYTDNNVVDALRSSMTSSYFDADNISSAPENNPSIFQNE